MSVGRKPIVDGLGLEAAGVDFDRKGIRVDEQDAHQRARHLGSR